MDFQKQKSILFIYDFIGHVIGSVMYNEREYPTIL